MPKCFIKLGEFKKALLLPLSLAFTQIILLVLDNIIHEKVKNHILESTSLGIGELLIIIIPHIKFFSISNKKEKTKCKCSKKIFLHYFILLILFALKANIIFVLNIKNLHFNNHSISMIKTENISFKQTLEIIIINILSKFLLKNKFFVHHYLSLILFCVFSLGIDILLKNYKTLLDNDFQKFGYCFILFGFLLEGSYYCYIKYMIDRHYHQYWNITLSVGIMILLANSISIVLLLMTEKGSMNLINYFHQVSVGTIISKFILNTLFQFAYSIFEILTIFYLSPEYILIAQNLSNIYLIIYVLVNRNQYITNKFQYFSFMFFIFQIFFLMVYLEIIELNFCNLNKNTRKNIELRADDEIIGSMKRIETIDANTFEISDGYIFDNSESDLSEKDVDKTELDEIQNEYIQDKGKA